MADTSKAPYVPGELVEREAVIGILEHQHWSGGGVSDGALEMMLEEVRRQHVYRLPGRTERDAAQAEVARLTAALAEAETRGWQPIETAPKDGSRILVAFDEGEIAIVHFDDGWWNEDGDTAWNDYYARWWMPLPLPPRERDGQEG